MHIGELAEKTGMSLRTLRHYDEVGLLTPSARTAGGFRLYTDEDLDRLLLIRRMKPLGFSLEEMAELLEVVDARASGRGDGESATRRLEEIATVTAERCARLEQQLEWGREFLALLQRQISGR